MDLTPDHLPVIDRVPTVQNLTVAAGFSGHGFCLGPVTGAVVADLVLEREPGLPIHPFRLERFAGGPTPVTPGPPRVQADEPWVKLVQKKV